MNFSDFSDFGLRPELLRAVVDLGFTEPTPIQRDAIPPALAGRDLLFCAMTGSGKTAAFLLPILHQLAERPPGTTRALVLSPTRELAAQTAAHLAELARHTPLRGAAVFGGVNYSPQEEAFKTGVDVLIATPGRLLDHFQHPHARLEGLEFLVLDEADRMLDMGFLPDIRRVLAHLPATPRQTMLVSATLPAPIVELGRELLRSPVAINVERPAAPAHGITQAVYLVREELKRYLLLELLKRGEIASAIVFTRTKHRANRLADFLVKHGVRCDRLHGNRSQRQRTEALQGFKAGKFQVLVATDIAARGLDVEALSHVVNFDVPAVPDDYIHRVGRTARAEATGDAWTLVGEAEQADLHAIERALGHRLEEKRLEGFDYAARPQEHLEVPLPERIAAIRARKAEERTRARANTARRAERGAAQGAPAPASPHPAPPRPAPPRSAPRGDDQPRLAPPPPPVPDDAGNRPGAHLASHLGPRFSARPAGRAPEVDGNRAPSPKAAAGPRRRRAGQRPARARWGH